MAVNSPCAVLPRASGQFSRSRGWIRFFEFFPINTRHWPDSVGTVDAQRGAEKKSNGNCQSVETARPQVGAFAVRKKCIDTAKNPGHSSFYFLVDFPSRRGIIRALLLPLELTNRHFASAPVP